MDSDAASAVKKIAKEKLRKLRAAHVTDDPKLNEEIREWTSVLNVINGRLCGNAVAASAASEVLDLLEMTKGKVFKHGSMAKLMSTTPTFSLIAKERSSGTTDKTIYFLTPGGFRRVDRYGDRFQDLLGSIAEETRGLLLTEVERRDEVDNLDPVSDVVRIAIHSWSQQSRAKAEETFQEAVALYVEEWDDFDLNGHLLGGEDCILDTSSGSVRVRDCTRDDHVSYNVGYAIRDVLTNQQTPEYHAFKAKLERIIKLPPHRKLLLKLLAKVALNGHQAWLLKMIMAVCGPKDSAKSTLFMYLLAALGPDYGGPADFNEFTTGQATGSTNDAALRTYLDRKRFCLIDEGEEEAAEGRPRKRLMHSRIKAFMSNTPKRSRQAHSHKFTQINNFPFFVLALNQSNMFSKPSNKDDLDRWLLINSDSLARFKEGVEDDEISGIFMKDANFVTQDTIKRNRLHMLSLLCEYYDADFNVEASIPPDLLAVRDEWRYEYEGGADTSLAIRDGGAAPSGTIYVAYNEDDKSPEEIRCDLVDQVADLLTPAPGKLVTLVVRLCTL